MRDGEIKAELRLVPGGSEEPASGSRAGEGQKEGIWPSCQRLLCYCGIRGAWRGVRGAPGLFSPHKYQVLQVTEAVM